MSEQTRTEISLEDRIAQAIGDPASIVGPRRMQWADGGDDPGETATRWATRAVLAVLADVVYPLPHTLTRTCVHPACHRTYQADQGPQERGWVRLRGLVVLCPDHRLDAASVPAARAQETDADCDQCTGHGWVRIAGRVTGAPVGYLTVTECTACNPDGSRPYTGQPEPGDDLSAVDPADARTAPAEGTRQGPATQDGLRAAEPDGTTNPAWLALLDQARAGGDQAGAAVCRAYSRGIAVGVQRATPPGPQDIPAEWLTALVRAAMDTGLGAYDTVRDAIRSAYRVGYAAAMGCIPIPTSAPDGVGRMPTRAAVVSALP